MMWSVGVGWQLKYTCWRY